MNLFSCKKRLSQELMWNTIYIYIYPLNPELLNLKTQIITIIRL